MGNRKNIEFFDLRANCIYHPIEYKGELGRKCFNCDLRSGNLNNCGRNACSINCRDIINGKLVEFVYKKAPKNNQWETGRGCV